MKKSLSIFIATVLIVGTSSIVYAKSDYNVKRIYGSTRYETSLNISNEFSSGQVENVILASGNDFPDALAGSVLSKKLNAPILLVDKTINSSQDSINYIKKHLNNSGTIYILGGEASVNSEYENYLKSIGYDNIERLGGANRFDTNRIIVDAIGVKKGTPVILANGTGFADALSISSIAAIKGYPILMTNSNNLPKETEAAIKEIEPSKVYIIGGQGSVDDSIADKVKVTTPSLSTGDIIRIAGSNRYETSLNICKYFNLNSSTAAIASGENFPDALSGSALAAELNAPIILSDGIDISNQKQYLDETNCSNLIIFGGKGAICNEVEDIFRNNVSVTDLKLGNTPSNMANGSMAVYDGEWVYYIGSQCNIYKSKLDGSSETKLYTCSSKDYVISSLNLMGDNLYFCVQKNYNSSSDSPSEYHIHKLKIDGTEDEVINILNSFQGVYRFQIMGDYLYFLGSNHTDNGMYKQSMYKISIDEKNDTLKEVTEDDLDISSFCLYHGNIYYSTSDTDGDEKNSIYRLSADGSQAPIKLVSEIDPIAALVVDNDLIYYVNEDGIFSIMTDGTNRNKISDKSTTQINVSGGYIYASCDEGIPYKMKLDGTDCTKLSDIICVGVINIINNEFYGEMIQDCNEIFRINNDGTNFKIIREDMGIEY